MASPLKRLSMLRLADCELARDVGRCPRWVKSRLQAASAPSPFTLQHRTSGSCGGMSVLCRRGHQEGAGIRPRSETANAISSKPASEKPDNRISHVIVGQMHRKRPWVSGCRSEELEPPDRCRTTQPNP